MIERCEECGVVDALGRHDPMCAYALRIGLPRLAEDEEPIDPAEAEDDDVLPGDEGAPLSDEPGRIELRQPAAGLAQLAIERGIAPAPPTALWISYVPRDGVADFDAVVFESELEALRYAVGHGEKVQRLELGRSLREQVSDDA